MAEPNPWLDKSQAERARQRALLDQADAADGARLDVAAAFALKWAMARLKGADKDDETKSKIGKSWTDISPQAYPKENVLAKPAGLSETEVANIGKAVRAALEKAGG